MPVLLTDKNKLSSGVSSYLSKNKPSNLYIVGLEGSVDKNVENAVDGMISKTAVRLGGKDRFETNVNILKQFESDLKFDKVYVALGDGSTGNEFADALSGAALAAEGNSPIVLTYKSIPKSSIDYMKNKVNANSVVILIGGQAAIPAGF